MPLDPFSDSLTLQLWKDRSDAERNPPTKGSIALEGYLGWEAGFTLDRESLTLALVLGDAAMVTLAFDARETMMRWQVRYSIPNFQVPTSNIRRRGQMAISITTSILEKAKPDSEPESPKNVTSLCSSR